MERINGRIWIVLLIIGAALVVGCSGTGETAESTIDDHGLEDVEESEHDRESENANEGEHLALPELEAAALDGAPLKVVATTSIIGDVVAQVGGDAIALTTLMGPGQDPHSFEPSARALTAVTDAHIIIVNGWDLEEALVHDLEEIGENVPLAAISANIAPLPFDDEAHEDEAEEPEHEDEAEEHEHEHGSADPHVWFNIDNVEQWVKNVEQLLSELDPANTAVYQNNAAAYLAELAELKAMVASELANLPAENRLLVTNHDALSYFVDAYDFELIGTVIPSASSLAEPSASDLTGLISTMADRGVCTIFVETAVSDSLAQTVAGELNDCDEVKVVPLYTGTLGAAGSGADSYIGMFRTNIEAIVAGLQ